MLLNKRLDVWSNGRSIKAHHKQLALHGIPLANLVAAGWQRRPTIVLHHGDVSRILGRIAHGMDGVEWYCSPIEIIPHGIELLRLGHGDDARRMRSGYDLGLRGHRGLNVTRICLLMDERWGKMEP